MKKRGLQTCEDKNKGENLVLCVSLAFTLGEEPGKQAVDVRMSQTRRGKPSRRGPEL